MRGHRLSTTQQREMSHVKWRGKGLETRVSLGPCPQFYYYDLYCLAQWGADSISVVLLLQSEFCVCRVCLCVGPMFVVLPFSWDEPCDLFTNCCARGKGLHVKWVQMWVVWAFLPLPFFESESVSRSVMSSCLRPPGRASSVHGILQARILEWVAISFSRGSSPPRDGTWVSCTVGEPFTIWATREALLWDWNKNWPFPVLWPPLSFPNLLTCGMQHFNSISF